MIIDIAPPEPADCTFGDIVPYTDNTVGARNSLILSGVLWIKKPDNTGIRLDNFTTAAIPLTDVGSPRFTKIEADLPA